MSKEFWDQAVIEITSGHGGKGAVSFRREKYVPRGGPDGGDGGWGGDIIFEATTHMDTLLDYKFTRHYKAEDGGPGRSNNRHGADGKDRIIVVPVGTIIRDDETEEELGDLTLHGQQLIAALGGKGGKGNENYKSATRQTPLKSTPGGEAVVRKIRLELKLIAQIGLVGFPNAGKSTLLGGLTQAHPKIAPYPFTTLSPNLGVLVMGYDRRLVLADLPGLIEGASEGKGLGLDFLRHIERTEILLYVLDAAAGDLEGVFKALHNELATYSETLADKPSMIALNKIDLLSKDEIAELPKKIKGVPCVLISAAGRVGLDGLADKLEKRYRKLHAES